MFNKAMFDLYIKRSLITIGIFLIIIIINFFNTYSYLSRYVDAYNYINSYGDTTEEELNSVIFEKYNLTSYGVYYDQNNRPTLALADEIKNGIRNFTDSIRYIMFFAAIAYAVKLLLYTNCCFISILPYKKYVHFIYQWLSGFIMIALTYIISFAMTKYLQIDFTDIDIVQAESIHEYMSEIYYNLLQAYFTTILVYTGFIMFSRLFGNPVYCVIACLLFCFGLVGFYFGFRHFLSEILNIEIYIRHTTDNINIIPYLCIGTVICFVIGMLLNNIYPFEKIGSIFTYSRLSWVVYIAGGIFGGFSFYEFIYRLTEIKTDLPGDILIIFTGIFITVFSAYKIINLTENGGDSHGIISFIKARI